MPRVLHDLEFDVVFDGSELRKLRELISTGVTSITAANAEPSTLRLMADEFLKVIDKALNANETSGDLDELDEEIFTHQEGQEAEKLALDADDPRAAR